MISFANKPENVVVVCHRPLGSQQRRPVIQAGQEREQQAEERERESAVINTVKRRHLGLARRCGLDGVGDRFYTGPDIGKGPIQSRQVFPCSYETYCAASRNRFLAEERGASSGERPGVEARDCVKSQTVCVKSRSVYVLRILRSC